jgi:aminoglycoside 6-adenylyltransferase
MNQTTRAYEMLIEKVTKWGETRPDIRALFIVGSRARIIHPADEWSDLDIIIITTRVKYYLSRSNWFEVIGKPWISFTDSTSTGNGKAVRVIFEGGLDVDFAFIPQNLAQTLIYFVKFQKIFPILFRLPIIRRQMEKADGFSAIVCRGTRVLLDKDGFAAYLPMFQERIKPPSPPTISEYLETVNDFWYHAIWTAKHIRRGELWWAKSGCDERMKFRLRKMIEWHIHGKRGWEYETWIRGRFLEEWADPSVLTELQKTFARYDESDLWCALLATMNLFHRLALETAAQLNYLYPISVDQYATRLVSEIRCTRLIGDRE